MELHHIGYLVKDMERAVTEFCALGYQTTSEIVYDAFRDIRICFLSSKAMPHGGVLIELVMPVSDASVVASLAKKLGASPYHLCYLVDDLAEAAAALRARGYVPMAETTPAPALHDSPAAFYFHRQVGIVELICHD